jgi:subtilisin family serine protease
VSAVSPALAETPTSPEVESIPAALEADLSASEERTLAATTSGEGVPLAAFVTTPEGPEIVTLDAGSPTDAAAAATLLEGQPSVEAADVSTVVHATGGSFAQYGNTMLRSAAARTGVDNPLSDVVVAVLDTGVSPHSELVSALVPGQNFTTSAGGALDATDRHGHGTHVAGTIAADAGSGVEGIAYGARIMPVKVLSDTGSGYTSWIASGIVWAADHGADVINMSLGGSSGTSVEASAIAYARSKGVTVLAAAGNDNVSTPSYPAAHPGVVAVSAVDQTKAKAWFSNYGSYIDVAAPGVSILSTHLNDGFGSMSGTSMASPHVAGVAALIEGAAPGLTPDQVEQVLVASVTDLGTPGRDDLFGHGLLDAPRAVQAANTLENGTPPPAPVSVPGAPTIGTPAPGTGSVTVRWTAPADNGGAAISAYAVRAYRAGALVKTASASAGATSLALTGLTTQPHTFTVTAVNAAGAGTPSAHSAAVTPTSAVTVPGAPVMGKPVVGSSAVRVKWVAPTRNGGSPVTGYTVRVYRGTTPVTTVTTTATELLVRSLANGTAYSFTVAARNAVGTGTAVTVKATPRTVASAPRIGTPTAGAGAATVRWAAPTSNGGAPLTGYTIRAYRGSALVKTVSAAATATSATVTGLTNGSAHTFLVSANNAAGSGAASARSVAVVPRTVASPPKIIAASAGTASVAVTWARPNNGGAAITAYVVRVYQGSTLAQKVAVAASRTSLTVGSLTPGRGYTVRVSAVNAAGTGALSPASATLVPRR